MSRGQYQQENQQNNDLFEEYLNDLPDEEMKVSSRVEQDVQQIVSEKKQKKQHRAVYISGTVIAVCLALGLNLYLGSIARQEPAEPDPVPVFTPDYKNPTLTPTSDYNRMVIDAHSNQNSEGVLGTDLPVPEMMVKDDYYRLPVPLSRFLLNGWRIGQQVIENQTEDGFYRIHYTLTYLDNSTTLEVTAVKPVSSDVPSFVIVTGIKDTGGLVELPQSIRSGMSEDDLLNLLNDSGIITTTVEGGSAEKTVTVDNAVDMFYFQSYHIDFDLNEGTISTITLTVE